MRKSEIIELEGGNEIIIRDPPVDLPNGATKLDLTIVFKNANPEEGDLEGVSIFMEKWEAKEVADAIARLTKGYS